MRGAELGLIAKSPPKARTLGWATRPDLFANGAGNSSVAGDEGKPGKAPELRKQPSVTTLKKLRKFASRMALLNAFR